MGARLSDLPLLHKVSKVDKIIKVVRAALFTCSSYPDYPCAPVRLTELSRETLHSLLELLCYHNCDDTQDRDRLEERWFAGTTIATRVRNTWK